MSFEGFIGFIEFARILIRLKKGWRMMHCLLDVTETFAKYFDTFWYWFISRCDIGLLILFELAPKTVITRSEIFITVEIADTELVTQ